MFVVAALLLVITVMRGEAQPANPRPEVCMMPPAAPDGRALRTLFEKPDEWKETRSLIDVLGYADHMLDKQFTDDELRAWLPMIPQWGLKFELEVGAVKPWGTTGRKTFDLERKHWDRFLSLGGHIDELAMDEPLCCVRKVLKKPDEYAVEETAQFIALVRTNYPGVRIGEIEPYPFIPLADQMTWITALEKRLADLHVRGLDFYRLDVNWAVFIVFDRGNWQEARKLELFCRHRKLPFSLIYWDSVYPNFSRRGMADDSTWYVGIMQQGYNYALVDGRPDQVVIGAFLNQ